MLLQEPICVRGLFAIETGGKKEEGRKAGRKSTYLLRFLRFLVAVVEAACEYRDCRETERRPSKTFDSRKLTAPASSCELPGFVRRWSFSE